MGRLRASVMAVGMLVAFGGAVMSVLPNITVPAVVPDVGPEASTVLAGVAAADRRQFKDFYAAIAEIVVRDGVNPQPEIKSVFDLRNRHRSALVLAFGATSMSGKYKGLGDRLDQYLLLAIGDTDVALTPELRAAASKAFLSIK